MIKKTIEQLYHDYSQALYNHSEAVGRLILSPNEQSWIAVKNSFSTAKFLQEQILAKIDAECFMGAHANELQEKQKCIIDASKVVHDYLQNNLNKHNL